MYISSIIQRAWKNILQDIGIQDDAEFNLKEQSCFKFKTIEEGKREYLKKNGKRILQPYAKVVEHLIKWNNYGQTYDNMVEITCGKRKGFISPMNCGMRAWSKLGTWFETQLRMLALDMYADELYDKIPYISQAGVVK